MHISKLHPSLILIQLDKIHLNSEIHSQVLHKLKEKLLLDYFDIITQNVTSDSHRHQYN